MTKSVIDIEQQTVKKDPIWQQLRLEAEAASKNEPMLASFLHATLLNHQNLESAFSFHLAQQLDSPTASALMLREIIEAALTADPNIGKSLRCDLLAVKERDSACHRYSTAFLYYKGFLALQAYRIAHWLWQEERVSLALFLQSLISIEFAIDIHPAAKIGSGIMLDHGSGIVIGETAVVGDNVSIMQSVTLGGTGKEDGDRHPKIGNGVLISAGAKILGNIKIGDCCKISAGSVVLKDIPERSVVAGVPATIIGETSCDQPALNMDHDICCD